MKKIFDKKAPMKKKVKKKFLNVQHCKHVEEKLFNTRLLRRDGLKFVLLFFLSQQSAHVLLSTRMPDFIARLLENEKDKTTMTMRGLEVVR